ncbi:HNH endonuclease signature motif containing protein [Paramicrobacterium fandaimingii]|uniref:HNH endonuclease signature motif containing protein n=1 Tax=Paramicrobacterium fandaimingii TaxID=2708079 RepID=UPI001422AB71|nr:HNH endonuclease signature motif containing protein [Microbacterium fandaimingii]
MDSQRWCSELQSPLPMGDTGARLGDEYWMIRDAVELEDESMPPSAEFGDALVEGLDAVGAAYDQAQRAEAFVVENLYRAHDVYVRSRDSVLAHSSAESHPSRLSDDQAMERSFVSEVAAKIGVADRIAEGMIHEAITLIDDLPQVMDAFRVGFTSYVHARAAARQAWSLPVEARAEFDDAIVGASRTQTPTRFTQTARKTREKLHPESIQTRKNAAFDERRVEHDPAEDGMAYLSLYHSADVTTSIVEQATSRARALRAAGDPRTLQQIEADLIAEASTTGMLVTTDSSANADADADHHDNRGAAARGTDNPSDDDSPVDSAANASGDPDKASSAVAETHDSDTVTLTRAQFATLRPGVVITVPALSLIGRSAEQADLAGYGPIDPDTANMLIGQATSFVRVLTDPITGAHRYTDAKKYRLSEKMKRDIRLRDVTCDFLECNAPAAYCDIDHIQAWEDGGLSTADNLHALCRRHHTLKHTTNWTPLRLPDGRVQWTSPAGIIYVTRRE